MSANQSPYDTAVEFFMMKYQAFIDLFNQFIKENESKLAELSKNSYLSEEEQEEKKELLEGLDKWKDENKILEEMMEKFNNSTNMRQKCCIIQNFCQFPIKGENKEEAEEDSEGEEWKK